MHAHTHSHAEAIFIHSSERKQIRAHYHRLHAHKSVCTHKGAWIILASRKFIILFYGAEEEEVGGRRRWWWWDCCFAAPPVIRRLCLCACEKGSSSKINTSSAQISSRAWRTCGEMSWFEDTLLVMDLTWTWPPASPNVMNVLFNLPVFVNLPLDEGTAVLWGWNNISSLAFGFWWCTIMTVIIEPHHRDLSQHPHILTGAALYFQHMWVNCRDTDSNKHRRLVWLRTNL